MKLWQKNSSRLHEQIEAFTVGQDRELDLRLAPYDVLGSLAHIRMLESVGLLKPDEWRELDAALKQIYPQTQSGEFQIADTVEDVHSQIEWMLTQQLGDTGKKIHSGRSRNDQVLVDLCLYFRSEITELFSLMQDLFISLQQKSEQHKEVLMPGYTHLQVGMVSSFGLWFGAYAEALTDDLQMLLAAYRVINQNPLGSAAGYGSSFPLDRKLTTRLLGFEQLSCNAIHAQMGRGKKEWILSTALASLAHTLSKLAMDVCLFCNQNYDFIKLDPAFTTGSSIMPHKKNPDVFELIRGRAAQLMSLPNEILMLTASLPSGYHRDFQLLKEKIFPAIDSAKDLLTITNLAIAEIAVKEKILEEEKYRYVYTVEAVNDLVRQDVPFRDAYRKIGEQVDAGDFSYDKKVQHQHLGSIGNLGTELIAKKWKKLAGEFNFNFWQEALQELVGD